MTLADSILRRFEIPGYALILVHDPDGLLADESIRAALIGRGCTVVQVDHPLALYQRVAQIDYDVAHPLVIVTADPLSALPYSLWQTGHRLALSLHDFFARFSLPVVRELSPDQRWRLAQVAPPARTLGRNQTVQFVLEHVFAAQPARLRDPGRLIAWLNTYHQQNDPLPPLIATALLAALREAAPLQGWPLDALLDSQEAFQAFVTAGWQSYVQSQTDDGRVREPSAAYLTFGVDVSLQDALAPLVRSGTLARIPVADPSRLEAWAQSGVLAAGAHAAPQRAAELLAELADMALDQARWPQWQTVARLWAEWTGLRYSDGDRLSAAQLAAFDEWRRKLDVSFRRWLETRYATLGAQKLPAKHLFHVVHEMAHAWDRRHGLALIVVDGMSLVNWQRLRARWQERRPDWRLHETLLLSQVPTITAVARQALVSGLRPMDFADSLDTNRQEPRLWQAAWERLGVRPELCAYQRLASDQETLPAELSDHRLIFRAIITRSFSPISPSSFRPDSPGCHWRPNSPPQL